MAARKATILIRARAARAAGPVAPFPSVENWIDAAARGY
jgi:hypothetical protein